MLKKKNSNINYYISNIYKTKRRGEIIERHVSVNVTNKLKLKSCRNTNNNNYEKKKKKYFPDLAECLSSNKKRLN